MESNIFILAEVPAGAAQRVEILLLLCRFLGYLGVRWLYAWFILSKHMNENTQPYELASMRDLILWQLMS